ncbi:ABC transporter permease [Streptomyces collinus]|uniref:Binding-protein-dependent transporters inner membrane component n=1 Tax=Streptomyces collinus (strain DSM 40733 / Tue 365) TaxID=1214242 RepID=S5UKS5_STRC3|nr:ABC transporter permease [Streptomyces collinus]AGS67473.1 binding-protein-dependent transporters inner membrane component [Streptomyces collinus Tu 365]UJA06154.1 ABC transporter permease [Streptomyces collinus]UJA12676.1 ABC transporter permease [Streptomyces collinus]
MTLLRLPTATAPARPAPRARARRGRADRRPRLLVAVTAVFFVLLYLPIGVVTLFSFNSKKSLTVFGGFSLRWYRAFVHDDVLLASLGTSLRISLVAMAGSVVLGVALALGLVRCRTRLGSLAGLVMLVPLITPEIVTGVASMLLFKGLGVALSTGTVMLAEITFSISYVTVILRSRVAALHPEVEEAAMDLGATRWQALRLVTLPALLPAVLASAVLIFALVFDDFVLAYFTTGVDPQPLSVRIYSAIRFGVQPTINAVGTLMLAGSVALIALALFIPRLFGRRGGLDILSGE